MEDISNILSALCVLYAFIFIYAQILSDKVEKFLAITPPTRNEPTAQKVYKTKKRALRFISIMYVSLNFVIFVCTVPIVIRIISEYTFSFSINVEILPAFVLCIFCLQAITFVYAIYLCWQIK